MDSHSVFHSKLLPPLFEMDDYSHCLQNENNVYCNVEGKLATSDVQVNEIIQDFGNKKWIFDRSIIHRTICLQPEISQNLTDLYSYSTKLLNTNIHKFNMSVEVDDATCMAVKPIITMHDKVFLTLSILYIGLVFVSTYYGKRYKNDKGIKRVLSSLSLSTTWEQKTRIPKNIDFQNLSSMQGIRLFTMLIIILGHVVLGYISSHILNIGEFEQMMSHPLIHAVMVTFTFGVLVFFLLSSWLLTVQVYNIFEQHGEFSLKHVGILILNRYFRLITSVGVLILLLQTSWPAYLPGPTNFPVTTLNQQACRRSWLSSVFFISNFQHLYNICNSVTWYVSADFQLYILNIMILYTQFKLKLNGRKLFYGCFAVSYILHLIVVYGFETKVIFIPFIRNAEIRHINKSIVLLVSYMSTITNWSSGLIGVIMGDIYYKTKNKTVTKNWPITISWITAFFFLPLLAICLTCTEMDGFKEAIVKSITRPLFTLGIGLGILGMSHKIGGKLRNILEAKFFIILSNFLYCVYLVHFSSIILVNRQWFSPIYVNAWKVVQDFIVTVILSFVCGIFTSLIIEQPGITLQKKYLPQVSKWMEKPKD